MRKGDDCPGSNPGNQVRITPTYYWVRGCARIKSKVEYVLMMVSNDNIGLNGRYCSDQIKEMCLIYVHIKQQKKFGTILAHNNWNVIFMNIQGNKSIQDNYSRLINLFVPLLLPPLPYFQKEHGQSTRSVFNESTSTICINSLKSIASCPCPLSELMSWRAPSRRATPSNSSYDWQ